MPNLVQIGRGELGYNGGRKKEVYSVITENLKNSIFAKKKNGNITVVIHTYMCFSLRTAFHDGGSLSGH